MDSGLLSLKWENHRNAFFNVLYRIRRNGLYCDTTIACDGKFYKVNKIVLSTCSDYLHQMLEEANIGSASLACPIIVLKDIRHDHLEALLDYMYIGEVNVLQSELASLIKAAEYLQIKGLAVPDDPKSNYVNTEKRELETGSKSDFVKRTKIGEKDEQRKEINIGSPRQGNDNVDNSLINECNSDIFEHRFYNNYMLENTENNNSDILENKNSTTSSENQSSPDIYNEKKKNNEDTIKGTYHVNNQESLLIKEELLDNSSHLYIDENNYSKEYSNSNYAPGNPQTSKSEDICNKITPESMQTLENLSNDSCNLGSQEIGLRNIVNSPEKSPINLIGQNIHKQFNILNSGAKLWPHSSQTTTQGVSCPFCFKLYYRKDAFLYHYKTHIGNKPYSCPYCNQSFIQKGSLKTHIKTHTGEKPFPCPMCSKRFIQKVHLENHILTHTGEKPLPCPYCSHRFARKDILKEHISRWHPGYTM